MIFEVDMAIWKTLKLKDMPYIFYTATPQRGAQPLFKLYGLLGNGHIMKTVYQGRNATDTAMFVEYNINHWNIRRVKKISTDAREAR